MGYIKKLKNNELVGGTDKTTIYPVTSTKAVFEEVTDGDKSSFKSQETINKEQQDELDDHEERIQAAEVEDIKSITINGSTKKFRVDDKNNVDLTIYTVDSDPEMPDIADNVRDLRNMVGTSTPVLETSHKTRIETLEGSESVTGSVENKIKTKVDSINSSYQDDNNEYVKYSMTQVSGEVTDFNIDETSLKNAITSLNTSISGDNIIVGPRPTTGLPGKIYRVINSSNNTYTDYMYSNGSWIQLAIHDTSDGQAQVAYYTCIAAGSGAQTTKQFVGRGSLTYTPSSGGHIKILMGEANTATGTIYLQFGTTTSTKKPLYYNGEPASASNTWEAGETIAVYYDPSANNNAGAYFASNAQGGGGKAEKISYDNSQSGLSSKNVQGALDSLSPLLGTDTTAFSLSGNNNTLVYRTFVLEAGKKYIIKTDMVTSDYSSSTIPDTMNVYSVTPYINGAYGTPVFSTRKNIDTPPQQYSFVAVDAEYYSVGIRADSGMTVSFWLEEVDLIIDNEPTVGSNGLVRSGGVYDFVSPLNPHSFTLVGAGDTPAYTTFKLEAGEEYTIEVDMGTFVYSNVSNYNIFSVFYYVGAKSYPVFTTMKENEEVKSKHTFTAVEADYYSVLIRANAGAEVKLYLYKTSGIPVDDVPRQHSPNVVRSGGLYKMQTLNRELSVDSLTCAWGDNTKLRYRCAIRVPYIPAYVKVDNKPDGYYVSIQSNLTLSDALSSYVDPVQYSAWNELEYTFDDDSAHYICLNIRNLTNTAMTDSDIENFSQMRITLYPWIAASDGGDDIVSLNNEAETTYYLESANLQDHGWSGSSYTTKAKPVVLLHFSDLHGNAENLKRIVEFKNHYSDYINDAIGSGDLVRDTLADDWTFWNAAGAEDILQATGNHEYYVSAPSYSWATTQQVYNKFFGNINNWGVTGHPSGTCYYYKDYTAQNLRLIVLDSLINDAAQTTWLQGLLDDVLANHQTYHVLFVAHTAPFNKTGIPCPFQTLSDWDAWFAWRDYMDTIAGIVDTFIANGGKFVGWLCGHTHRDFFCKLTDHPNQLFVSVGCATDMSDWAALKNGTDMFRESYTKSMDLFNIVTIDTDASRLKLKRIGADLDRDLRKKGSIVYDYENRKIVYSE